MKNLIRSFFTTPPAEKFFFLPFLGCLFKPFRPGNILYPHPSVRRCTRNGVHYELDLSEYMDHAIYYGSVIEERQNMYGLAREGMVVFDIGANLGETALGFAGRVGRSGRVYAFEPVDVNFNKLIKNIELNNTANITAQQLALSDREEIVSFGYTNNNNSSAIGMAKDLSRPLSIRAVTADKFVVENMITRVDLLKIDVEGFEMFVLKGAEQILKKHKPLIYIEVCDQTLKQNGYSARDLIQYLEELGYCLHDARTKKPISRNGPFEGIHIDVICI